MPKENNEIIRYNHVEKSMKAPFIIYADMESLLEKISTYYNIPKKSATKTNKHTTSGYSLFTHGSFDATKNELDYYRAKDCMKKFCEDLRKYAMKIVNYIKKEMIPLTIEESKSYHKQKVYVCKKKFE